MGAVDSHNVQRVLSNVLPDKICYNMRESKYVIICYNRQESNYEHRVTDWK